MSGEDEASEGALRSGLGKRRASRAVGESLEELQRESYLPSFRVVPPFPDPLYGTRSACLSPSSALSASSAPLQADLTRTNLHPTHTMRIAVIGCSHGTLDDIYASVERCHEEAKAKGEPGIDLMICCGDFQVRSQRGSLPCNKERGLDGGEGLRVRPQAGGAAPLSVARHSLTLLHPPPTGDALPPRLASHGLPTQVSRPGPFPSLLLGAQEGSLPHYRHWGQS